MSLRFVAARPLACSGAMYAAVPRITPACVIAGEVIVGDWVNACAAAASVPAFGSRALAKPKSSTFTVPSGRTYQFDGPAAFCTQSHRDLAGTRGAAIALAQVSQRTQVRFAGVGNISGTLVTPEAQRGMLSQNGTVGYQPRPVQQLDYPWPGQGCLVMHSDGLTNRWSLGAYPGLMRRHPAVIAGVLYRDCLRGRDDATIVVVGDEPAS